MKQLKLLFLLVFIISCNHDGNAFDEYLVEIPQRSVEEFTDIDDVDNINTPYLMAVNNEYIVAVEARLWTLHLLNQNGEFLSSAGGPGNGPGEFQQIKQVFFADDDSFYALDSMSQILSRYIIEDDELVFKESMALPDYSPYRLQKIHVTPEGPIGVFKDLGNSGDAGFTVHQLDVDFQMKEQLLTLPADDFLIRNGIKVNNPFGKSTLWHVNGNNFYFLTTDKLAVSVFDLKLREIRVDSIDGVPQSNKTSSKLEDLKSNFGLMLNRFPQLEEYVDTVDTFPLILSFLPTDNYYYYTTFNMGNEPGKILSYNRKTGIISKIEVPPMFNLYGADEEKLYGINHTDRMHDIMFFSIN